MLVAKEYQTLGKSRAASNSYAAAVKWAFAAALADKLNRICGHEKWSGSRC